MSLRRINAYRQVGGGLTLLLLRDHYERLIRSVRLLRIEPSELTFGTFQRACEAIAARVWSGEGDLYRCSVFVCVQTLNSSPAVRA